MKSIDGGCQLAQLAAVMADEIRIHVRIDQALKDRVKTLTDLTGLDEATLVRKSLESIAEYFDEHGVLSVPFKLVPDPSKHGQKKGLYQDKRSRTTATTAPTVLPPSSSTRFSVNEEAPEKAPHKQASEPKVTRARAALKEMTKREGGKAKS